MSGPSSESDGRNRERYLLDEAGLAADRLSCAMAVMVSEAKAVQEAAHNLAEHYRAAQEALGPYEPEAPC